MSTQKNIILKVNPPTQKRKIYFETIAPAEDCDINIQVANGWAITGHYQNHTLQTVTLQKTTHLEAK